MSYCSYLKCLLFKVEEKLRNEVIRETEKGTDEGRSLHLKPTEARYKKNLQKSENLFGCLTIKRKKYTCETKV